MCRIVMIILMMTALLYSGTNAQEVNSYEEKRNDYILILNSHHSENAWSNDLSNLIRYKIEEQHPNLIVSISYAGVTDRVSFLSGRFGMQAAFANGRVNKDISIPSVLILIGDESWMYYRIMNLRGIWENIPVVLVDVHAEIMNDFSKFHFHKSIPDSLMIPLHESKNGLPVTAIMNKDNEGYTVWLMKQLIPNLNEIVFLSTGGYRDEYALDVLKKTMAIQFPEIKLSVLYNRRQKNKDIQAKLSNLSKNAAVLLGSGELPDNVDIPVFQLTDRQLQGNTVIGGYYPLKKDYASKVADIALKLHQGESIDAIPFSFIDDEVPCLNKTALNHFHLNRTASDIPDVVYANVPPSFWVKYMRSLFLLALTVIVLVIILILNLREKLYRTRLARSMDKYKKVYDEYQILYENMPVGLAFFDSVGNLQNRNQSSELFFDKVPENELPGFNLFQTKMLDVQSKMKVSKNMAVNKVLEFDDRTLRLIFRYIQDETSDSKNTLMMILDYTDIQKEEMAKNRIHDIFSFAMDASSLGVAEYNVITNSRYATDAWYKNLCIDEDEEDIYRSVVKEDRERIEYFLANIGEGGEVYFAETIRVIDGDDIHWMQYIIQLLEYGPEEGRIIVAELLLNVDKQKCCEQELDLALQATKESDRLKNAFIANMSSDIRPALDELVIVSNRLIETNNGEEKESLMERIEHNNDMLLNYVERIIELSKIDINKNIRS